ncbi:BrnT family toxin [Terriglobus sp. RCC_193]|uniref:BrnT family toxin n=1 Tax=Terriglobus sp. RCC_193 TaxID=3239218 RepID=UPI0035235490
MEYFQWDEANRAHIARHDVTPQEVEEVLIGGVIELDVQHAEEEIRFLWIGEALRGRILVVVFTERDHLIRPITAYDPDPYLKRRYLQEKGATQ